MKSSFFNSSRELSTMKHAWALTTNHPVHPWSKCTRATTSEQQCLPCQSAMDRLSQTVYGVTLLAASLSVTAVGALSDSYSCRRLHRRVYDLAMRRLDALAEHIDLQPTRTISERAFAKTIHSPRCCSQSENSSTTIMAGDHSYSPVHLRLGQHQGRAQLHHQQRVVPNRTIRQRTDAASGEDQSQALETQRRCGGATMLLWSFDNPNPNQ